MIHIAMVEDDKATSEGLQVFLKQFKEERKQQISVTVFDDALSLLDVYVSQFDIVLLDIELPTINGLEAAARIRKKDQETVIIFITYMAQYAVKGYEVNAFDYIVKPVNYFSFSQKLWRAVNQCRNRKDDLITLKTYDGIEVVSASGIKYIEVSGHNMCVHTTDKEISLRCSITEMEEKLGPYHFLRCNVCYLVNPKFIDRISENQVVMQEISLPISRAKKKSFLIELTEYFNKQRGGN